VPAIAASPDKMLRADDDDWGQAGTLVRQVMNDAERDRIEKGVRQ
jgi:catalase